MPALMHKRSLMKYTSHSLIIVTIFSMLCLSNALSFERTRAAAIDKDEWSAYGHDAGGTRYSPLTQVNRENVKQLKVAWEYHTGALEVKGRSSSKAAFEATPLFVDGTLYLTTPYNRVIALDPLTGKEIWSYDPKVSLWTSYSEMTSRGVSTWVDGRLKSDAPNRRRIIVATIDARLIALDATSGQLCKDFGTDGQVDLTKDVRLTNPGDYQVTSPPAVIGDLLIVGSSMGDNRGVNVERGVVRAYDARTGKLHWTWDPIPTSEQDPAYKTWKGDGAKRTGAANAWSIISADAERGLIFVPTSSASPDFYGVERKGDNRYANSVVAIRAATGKVVWHYQVVHHDLWDYDVAAQPMLINLKRDGRNIPAVAVATKMGHIFVLHRETGKPLFPIEERAVPKSTVPDEETSPTQPFPVKPRPIAPSKLTPDDAWGIMPADRDWCRERIKSLRSEGIFTPPSFEGTIMFPGNVGGTNWGGMAWDAKRNLLITATNRLATVVKLLPREEVDRLRASANAGGTRLQGEFGRMTDKVMIHRQPLMTPSGVPCNAPPWGALTAIDLVTGEVKWEVPLGSIPQLAMFPKHTEWGSLNLGGGITTASGLVFIAATMDTYFRAFDVETGKELWKAELPASAQATPMTFSKNGKQYVVICAGGHGKLGTKMGDSVVAFALP
jgi:quinoprotein glucose dehydrogenase